MNNPRFQSRFGAGLPINLLGAPQEEPPRKRSTWEVLATLIVPALSLVAAIVALQRDQRIIAWALLGVLFLSFAVGLYPLVKRRLQQHLSERRDRNLARKAFPEFRKFVRSFGEFAAAPSSRTDTLHAIVLGELCGGNLSKLEKSCPASGEMFASFSIQLRSRVEKQEGNLPNLLDGVEELNLLVRSYTQYCVEPIFSQFPQDLRPLLTDRAKSSFESFRERYVAFLDDYSKYLETLEESFSKPRIGPHYFPRPKPL